MLGRGFGLLRLSSGLADILAIVCRPVEVLMRKAEPHDIEYGDSDRYCFVSPKSTLK